MTDKEKELERLERLIDRLLDEQDALIGRIRTARLCKQVAAQAVARERAKDDVDLRQQCGHCGHSIHSHDTTGTCSYCLMVLRGPGSGVSHARGSDDSMCVGDSR